MKTNFSSALLLILILISNLLTISAQEIKRPTKERKSKPTTNIQNPMTHDPVLIKEGSRYYLFATGMGISVLSSEDLKTWRVEPSVFDKAPQWAVDIIPGFRGHIWAPDIYFYNNRYHILYSCSAFGKNTSAIGHASTATLDPNSPDYGWTDHGKVLQSVPFRDDWNAIDPNLIIDEEGTPWMNFGSFWGGIKLVKLTKDLQIAEPEEWYSISRRPRDFELNGTSAGNGAVEAPFIYRKGDYYYLFVSFDYCCRGNDSNYKIVVGRSKELKGPYLDKEGHRMDRNGGSVLLQGDDKWAGVGHCGVHDIDGKDYLVAHAYIKADNGASHLVVRTLSWDNENWPVVNPE